MPTTVGSSRCTTAAARDETIDALAKIITTLRKRGYELVTITQMLGYRLIYQ
jgi:polysaccharide deacetylase 2 family uncharacterized protein YibQ